MAVMTTQPTNGVAFEHKTQPVPSERMALDQEINGNTTLDETIPDATLSDAKIITTITDPDNDPSTSTALESSDGQKVIADATENNTVAAQSNAALDIQGDHPLSDNLFGSQTGADAQDPDNITTTTTTTTTTIDITSVDHLDPAPITDDLAPSEQALESALDPLNVTSAEPPTVQAEESDLRDEPIAAAQEAEAEAEEVTKPLTPEPTQEPKLEPETLETMADPPAADSAIVSDAPEVGSDAIKSGDAIINGDSTNVNGAKEEPIDASFTPSDEQPLHPKDVSDIDINAKSPIETPKLSPPTTSAEQRDTDMADAPASPVKVARERDEDMEDAPAPKRSKTDDESVPSPAVTTPAPPTPADAQQPSSTAPAVPASAPPASPDDQRSFTPNDIKALLKAVRGAKSSKVGANFKLPVATLWPTLAESYLEKVKNPIDLAIVEEKLKGNNGGYANIAAFKADINLMHANCVNYNGPDHPVTAAANIVREKLFSSIPSPAVAAPPKSEKKRKLTPAADHAARAPPARRPSRSSGVGVAGSPTAASQTFALDPSGNPLIRRDSTKGENGRPKREIHPPKPKEILYSSRPKKKKFVTELKFCEAIVADLQKPRLSHMNYAFLQPVDPVALNIPTYFNVVKNPMDLSTIDSKLRSGQYENAKEFEADIRLMFKNCFLFNPPGNLVHASGKELEQYFDSEWANKNKFIVENTPHDRTSGASDDSVDEESEEEEEVEEEAPNAATAAISARLIEEQTKLISMMASKEKISSAVIRMQQDVVAMVQEMAKKEGATTTKPTKPKKSAPAKAAKKSGPAKKKVEPKKQSGNRMRRLGTPEKELISTGIGMLDEQNMNLAIRWIQADMPQLDVSAGEVELDIEQVSTSTLHKLYDLVKTIPGLVPAAPAPAPARRAAPNKPKKNKPMSKKEQEAKIQALRDLEKQFATGQNVGSSVVPSVEQSESSDDEEDSESEEE